MKNYLFSGLRRLTLVILFIGPSILVTSNAAIAGYDEGLKAYAQKNYAQAIAEWSAPKLSDNPNALFALGVMHMRGVGIDQDPKLAVDYYQKSAQLGFASAQYNLALAYYSGNGVARDVNSAAKWWHSAAVQGHTVAQYNLGAILWSGDGVVQDQARAMQWFRLAKSNGNPDASSFLLTLFAPMYRDLSIESLESSDTNRNRSIPLIDEFGMYKLGLQALDSAAYAQAIGYWQPLAKDGHVDSQLQLARLYEHGLGVEKNMEQAISLYQQAAQKGQGDAQYRLGLYLINEAPEPNKALGFYWIQSAADNDSADAKQYIDSH